MEDFTENIKNKITSVFEYFEFRQPEDLDPNYRQDFPDIRPKSPWESSEKYTKWLQTNRREFKPSKPYQREHYENISEGTQTDFSAGHFAISAADKISWPYIGNKDPYSRITYGAPRYT